MQSDGSFLLHNRIKYFSNKDLSFPEVPGLHKQQSWLYIGQAFAQV